MWELTWFLIGVILGSIAMWYSFKPLHDAFYEIESKYQQIVNILQSWQKKI